MPAGGFEDTDPQALEVFIELHRKMTPGQRAAQIFELAAFMEGLQRSSVMSMYPHGDEREVFLRVAARRLDRDTMIRATGGIRTFISDITLSGISRNPWRSGSNEDSIRRGGVCCQRHEWNPANDQGYRHCHRSAVGTGSRVLRAVRRGVVRRPADGR